MRSAAGFGQQKKARIGTCFARRHPGCSTPQVDVHFAPMNYSVKANSMAAASICILLSTFIFGSSTQAATDPSIPDLVQTAVRELLRMQENDGAWPYEGVYRVAGEIPLGYRVGGTAIVAGALRCAAPGDDDVRKAVEHGVAFILDHLDDPLLAPSTKDAYDVRVWGQCYALELFCRLREEKYAGPRREELVRRIPKLIQDLLEEELPGGGWNY